MESISIQVKVGNYKPFIVTSIYRPPGNLLIILMILMLCLEAEDKESIYLGDTNCDMLDLTNNDTKSLKRLLTNLTQLIKSLT